MKSLLYALVDEERTAEQLRSQLLAVGVSRRAIQLLRLPAAEGAHVGGFGDGGAHMHDQERDHVGGFGDSGAHMHDQERDHAGGFGDSGAHMHGQERDHVGSFAAHLHADDVLRELAKGGVAQGEAEASVARMQHGATLVLAWAEAEQREQVAAILRAIGM